MNSTKMAIKWTRIDLQTSVIPIWNPENKGYKIGFEKRCWGQQECPKNGSENFRIYSANSVPDTEKTENYPWCLLPQVSQLLISQNSKVRTVLKS